MLVATTRKVYLGIDPGLSKTGLVVCILGRDGKPTIKTSSIVSTDSKMSTRDRFNKIRREIRNTITENSVNHVVCEAFEVRTWQKPMKSGTLMSRLINEISEEVYYLELPFVLSSPYNKTRMSEDDIPLRAKKKLNAFAKTNRPHVTDAYIHVAVLAQKEGSG